MDSLQKYGSDSSGSSDDSEGEDAQIQEKKEIPKDDDSTLHLKPLASNSIKSSSGSTQICIQAAPMVGAD